MLLSNEVLITNWLLSIGQFHHIPLPSHENAAKYTQTHSNEKSTKVQTLSAYSSQDHDFREVTYECLIIMVVAHAHLTASRKMADE